MTDDIKLSLLLLMLMNEYETFTFTIYLQFFFQIFSLLIFHSILLRWNLDNSLLCRHLLAKNNTLPSFFESPISSFLLACLIWFCRVRVRLRIFSLSSSRLPLTILSVLIKTWWCPFWTFFSVNQMGIISIIIILQLSYHFWIEC